MENKEYFGRVASIFRKVEDLLDEFEDEIDYGDLQMDEVSKSKYIIS